MVPLKEKIEKLWILSICIFCLIICETHSSLNSTPTLNSSSKILEKSKKKKKSGLQWQIQRILEKKIYLLSQKIPYLPMYKPWAYLRTQGFFVGLYTGGAYTQEGSVHEYKKVVSFRKACVDSMGNLHSKSSIIGVFCVFFMKNNCKTTEKHLNWPFLLLWCPLISCEWELENHCWHHGP